MELSKEVMYQAIIEKDTRFEGIFFTAVKTTGIFCRPSCRARKPKIENVEFFETAKECMLSGYRPCKTCRPLELLQQTPSKIQFLLDALSQDPSMKFSDQDLREKGINPQAVRRWFLQNHGITFHAYQRIFRINSAFKKIKTGKSITEVAFDAGFDSLSGFQDSFKTIFGVSPKRSKNQRVIDLQRLETPLGTMIACAVEQGVCLLEFTDRKMLERELIQLAKSLNATIIQGENPHFPCLEKELKEYFEGKRREFTVPLFTPGSEFQQTVWENLRQVSYGKTVSYKDQSTLLGKPNAVRAVANANGMNRISIIIPCHRVIGSNGNLTGYGGGIWRKQWLLDFEQKNAT